MRGNRRYLTRASRADNASESGRHESNGTTTTTTTMTTTAAAPNKGTPVDAFFLQSLVSNGDTGFVDDLVKRIPSSQPPPVSVSTIPTSTRTRRRFPRSCGFTVLGMIVMWIWLALWERRHSSGWWNSYMKELESATTVVQPGVADVNRGLRGVHTSPLTFPTSGGTSLPQSSPSHGGFAGQNGWQGSSQHQGRSSQTSSQGGGPGISQTFPDQNFFASSKRSPPGLSNNSGGFGTGSNIWTTGDAASGNYERNSIGMMNPQGTAVTGDQGGMFPHWKEQLPSNTRGNFGESSWAGEAGNQPQGNFVPQGTSNSFGSQNYPSQQNSGLASSSMGKTNTASQKLPKKKKTVPQLKKMTSTTKRKATSAKNAQFIPMAGR